MAETTKTVLEAPTALDASPPLTDAQREALVEAILELLDIFRDELAELAVGDE